MINVNESRMEGKAVIFPVMINRARLGREFMLGCANVELAFGWDGSSSRYFVFYSNFYILTLHLKYQTIT